MGLDQIRDLTRKTQMRILQERPFHSLSDFLTRVDPRPKEAENLIRVGALRGFGSIPGLLSQIKAQNWRLGQLRLFEIEAPADLDEWMLPLRVSAQLEILGASVDAHPLDLVADQLADADTISAAAAFDCLDEEIRVAGIRQTTQRFHSQVEGSFYMLELDDGQSVLPVRMTPEFYRYHQKWLSSKHPFIVQGKMGELQTTGEQVLIANKLWPI